MAKVKGVTIDLGEQGLVELSIEEARELFEQLRLFFDQGTIHIYRYDPYVPWWQQWPNERWYQPNICEDSQTTDGISFHPGDMKFNMGGKLVM